MWVSVCVRERESVCVCVKERESVCECGRECVMSYGMCVSVCECVRGYGVMCVCESVRGYCECEGSCVSVRVMGLRLCEGSPAQPARAPAPRSQSRNASAALPVEGHEMYEGVNQGA